MFNFGLQGFGFGLLDGDIKSIGKDIGRQLQSSNLSDEQKRKIQNEYFERVRGVLGIAVIGGNFWSRGHKEGSFLLDKEIFNGKTCDKTGLRLVTRENFGNIGEFLNERGISLKQERIPNRTDVEQLQTVEGGIRNMGFIVGDGYIFEDIDGKIGVFTINNSGNVKILEDISSVTYVRVRTIKIMEGKQVA